MNRGKQWISKREAITMVLAATDALVNRASARDRLADWVRAGKVRTRLSAEQPSWAKRPRRLYSRSDIAKRLRKPASTWHPHQEALLGTDYDHVIAKKLRRTVGAVTWKRLRLGIAPHGPSTRSPWNPRVLTRRNARDPHGRDGRHDLDAGRH